jgi:hypothetical protein
VLVIIERFFQKCSAGWTHCCLLRLLYRDNCALGNTPTEEVLKLRSILLDDTLMALDR